MRDVFDNDFGCVVLGRDALKRFRCVDLDHSLTSRKRTRTTLREKLAKWAKAKPEDFYQHDEKGKPLDFFELTVGLGFRMPVRSLARGQSVALPH